MKERDIISSLINDFPSFQKWVQHNFWRKSDYANTRGGTPDRFRPVTLNESGYVDDSLLSDQVRFTKNSVDSGDTLTIPLGYQYIEYGLFTVIGTVVVIGELVIL